MPDNVLRNMKGLQMNFKLPRLAKMPAMALVVAALAGLGACTPQAEDLAYPNLNRTPASSVPLDLLTPAERDAAISELRAEAAVAQSPSPA